MNNKLMTALKVANRLLFFLGIGITTAVIGYLVLKFTFGEGNPRIIYPIAFNSSVYMDLLSFSGVIFFGVLIGFIVVAVLYGWFAKEKPNMKIGAKAVYLVHFALGLMCVAPFAFVFSPYGSPFRYWESLLMSPLGNSNYHLMIYSPDPSESQFYYYLYQCDSFDLFCTEIYRESQFSVGLEVGNISKDSEKLIPDAAANTIALEINGEIVYTHRPDE